MHQQEIRKRKWLDARSVAAAGKGVWISSAVLIALLLRGNLKLFWRILDGIGQDPRRMGISVEEQDLPIFEVVD